MNDTTAQPEIDTVTQAPTENQDTNQQLTEDINDSLGGNDVNDLDGTDVEALPETDGAGESPSMAIADDAQSEHVEPLTLRPWIHPVTKQRRVYAKGGGVSPHDRLFIEKDPQGPKAVLFYVPTHHPEKRSHPEIQDDIQGLLFKLVSKPYDQVEFEDVYEAALLLEQQAHEKRLAAGKARAAETASESTSSVDKIA